jgi:hypothetical protein
VASCGDCQGGGAARVGNTLEGKSQEPGKVGVAPSHTPWHPWHPGQFDPGSTLNHSHSEPATPLALLTLSLCPDRADVLQTPGP